MAGLQSETKRKSEKERETERRIERTCLPCCHDNMEPVMVMMPDGMRWAVVEGWDGGGGGLGDFLSSLQLLKRSMGFLTRGTEGEHPNEQAV